MACLLVERGRPSEGQYIFNELQDVLPKGHSIIYNNALCEYLAKNYEKSLIILESPKSNITIKNSSLYALILTILQEFEKAELRWKFKYMRNPSLKTIYELASFFHEKAKQYFSKNMVDI